MHGDQPVPANMSCCASVLSSILAVAAAAAAAVLQLCWLSSGSDVVCLNYMEHAMQMLQAPPSCG